ncbi:MAG: hypothetical protein K0R19_2842 [Bacillota bacterium]|jgi:hypothetical protein|nr:hypothetical protein [Bacillota bacterium]
MHFKIIVSNGRYPLEYRCSTAAEAYGCIESLSTGLLQDVSIDLDEIMEMLVAMKTGKMRSTEQHKLSIFWAEGEV